MNYYVYRFDYAATYLSLMGTSFMFTDLIMLLKKFLMELKMVDNFAAVFFLIVVLSTDQLAPYNFLVLFFVNFYLLIEFADGFVYLIEFLLVALAGIGCVFVGRTFQGVSLSNVPR